MPTTIQYDDDADLALIQARRVAVIGYRDEPGRQPAGEHGDQVLAHALSLRDSGVEVLVGLPEVSQAWSAAADEGLPVLAPAAAAAEADLVVPLATETALWRRFHVDVGPHLHDGDALLFGHGFTVRYGLVRPPATVDVVMVSPRAPAGHLRAQFAAGRGVPCLVAVHADVTGTAWPLALSYAKAIGGTRAGVLRTTFAEATEAELFGEQAIRGGLAALVRAGFELLVDAGYAPEVAYLGCVQELQRTVAELVAGEPARSAGAAGGTAGYGARMVGPRVAGPAVADELRRILGEIADGTFAASWAADHGRPGNGEPKHAKPDLDAIERAASTVRALLPWPR